MAQCEVCGNRYDKSFDVIMQGVTHTFGGRRIIGHGMESEGNFYCCAHCAKQSGKPQMRDRVETRPHV